MIDERTIDELARLSRIRVAPSERAGLVRDFSAILAYVSEISSLPVEGKEDAHAARPIVRNVMREDGEPHEKGLFTDELLREAPVSFEGYVKVKKIL